MYSIAAVVCIIILGCAYLAFLHSCTFILLCSEMHFSCRYSRPYIPFLFWGFMPLFRIVWQEMSMGEREGRIGKRPQVWIEPGSPLYIFSKFVLIWNTFQSHICCCYSLMLYKRCWPEDILRERRTKAEHWWNVFFPSLMPYLQNNFEINVFFELLLNVSQFFLLE